MDKDRASLRRSQWTVGLFLVIAAFAVIYVFVSEQIRHPPHAVLLTVNDVYRLNGVGEPKLGGLPRLRTIREQLEQTDPDLLLLLAGDFLAPSLLSRMYEGKHMVDVMNRLDGQPLAFDHRFFVTFGNHEFDDNKCDDDGALLTRIDQSQFTWLNSNLSFADCAALKDIENRTKVRASKIIESGGINVGIFGLGQSKESTDGDKYPSSAANWQEIANDMTVELRALGAQIVVALTHFEEADDRLLLENVPGLDLVIGGHEHQSAAILVDGRWIFKADSDAKTAWKLDITLRANGTPNITGTLLYLNQNIAGDRATESAAIAWLDRHHLEYCPTLDDPLPHGCLDDKVGRTATLLEGDELANRRRETGLGNWIADLMRAEAKAEVAFINSGSLRLNYNIAAGATLTRRHIEELIEYDARLVVADILGSDLFDAVEHALDERTHGAWAHYSGIGLEIKTRDDGSLELTALYLGDKGSSSWVPLVATDTYTVAGLAYVLCGGDKHPFGIAGAGRSKCEADLNAKFEPVFSMTKEIIYGALDPTLITAITPEVEGRLCTKAPCLWSP